MNNLVDLVVPPDLDLIHWRQKKCEPCLLHAVLVNRKRELMTLLMISRKQVFIQIFRFKKALRVVHERLQQTIDEFEKLLSENYDTGHRFLSKLIQTLEDVMCRSTDHTTVVSLMAGIISITIKSIFHKLSHHRMSIPLSPLIVDKHAEILLGMNNFPSNRRTCQKFRFFMRQYNLGP